MDKQSQDVIPEVVLTAADTFHEMLAAYRNRLQPPVGGALRDHINRLLHKTAAAPEKSSTEAKFDWTEYQRLMIAEAFRRGESVYNVAFHLDSESLLPAAGVLLVRTALESAGK